MAKITAAKKVACCRLRGKIVVYPKKAAIANFQRFPENVANESEAERHVVVMVASHG
jgi:hypothetical protein